MKNNRLFVSVIVTTYNRKELLRQTINSILHQTYNNFELIVVDNYSDYDFIDFINSFNDIRLKPFRNKNHGIIAVNRNYGISKAIGDFIAFCDDDDKWYPNKLEEVYNFIINNANTDVIGHDLIQYNKNTGVKRRVICGPVVPEFYSDLLIHGNRFMYSGMVVKREAMVNNNIKFDESKEAVSVEDYDLWLQLVLHGAQFCCLNIPLGEYLLDTHNFSALSTHHVNLGHLLRRHVFEIQSFEKDKHKLWKKVNAGMNIVKGIESYHKRKYLYAIKFFTASIKVSKFVLLNYLFKKIRKIFLIKSFSN